tara:strand:+ start:162 stop:737 length:576 start_codon:yes stop_codon:yes gene_type:complete
MKIMLPKIDMRNMLMILKPTEKRTSKKGFSDESGSIFYNNKIYNFLIHSKNMLDNDICELNLTCPGRSDFQNPSIKMFDVRSIMRLFNATVTSLKCDNILITFQIHNLTNSHITILKNHPDFDPPKEMKHGIKFILSNNKPHLNKLTVVLFYTQNPPKINITGIKNFHDIDEIVQDCIQYIQKALHTTRIS